MHKTLSLWLALLFAATIGLTGCVSHSVERTTERTISASNITVDAALKAYYLKHAKREASNELTKESDFGGYLERKFELQKEHEKVGQLLEAYKLSTIATINAWISVNGAASASEVPAGGQVQRAEVSLLEAIR